MVTLDMWICMWIQGAETMVKQLIEREIRAFNRESSGINIEVTLIPWQNAWDNIIAAANEQRGPDILQVGSTWNGTLAHLGVLRDITQEFCDTGLAGDIFVPAAWSSCHFPGSEKISSLPWFVDIRTICYRTDIFRELGLLADSLDNWRSFEQTCKGIKGFEKGGKIIEPLGVSGQKDTLLLHNIAPWIWGAGGDFLSADEKQAAFNSEKALNGIAYYISLIRKGYIPLSALNLTTEEVTISFFTKGAYAMSIPGPESCIFNPAHPDYIDEIAENYMFSLFPSGPEGKFVFCGGSNLAVTSFSQYPKQAWELVKFLTSYDSQRRYPKILNMFPSLLESFGADFIKERPGWEGFRHLWKYGRAFPNVASWGAIESVLIEYFGKIFDRIQEGNYDISLVKQDLDKAAGEAENLLLMMG